MNGIDTRQYRSKSGAAARVLDDDGILNGGSEEEIADGEAEDDGDEDAGVEGHDSEHKEVSYGSVDTEDDGGGETSRVFGGEAMEERGSNGRQSFCCGEKLESEASVLHVLVEGGEDEDGEKAESVTQPGIGLPRVNQEGHLLPPVESHVHHLRYREMEMEIEIEIKNQNERKERRMGGGKRDRKVQRSEIGEKKERSNLK